MSNNNLKVTFLSHNRQPRCAPNPVYPEGIDVDLSKGAKASCMTALPYPAECCGAWLIVCRACSQHYVVTAAGRPDDPRTVRLPCEAEQPPFERVSG